MARASAVRYRLILNAERLFSDQGIEGTSLRQIAASAGLINNSAVQYHFGSKAGLIDALFRQRMDEMEPDRAHLLEVATSKGRLGDVRTLMEIICKPHLQIVDSSGRHNYAHFLCQYLLRHRPPGIGWLPETTAPAPANLRRTQELLRERLFYLPDNVVARRLVTAIIMYLSVLVNYDHLSASDDIKENLDEVLDDTIEQIVVAIMLPLRP